MDGPTVHVTGEAQQESWRLRTLPPAEQLRSDLWSVPVPIPDSPLRYVSAYVLASDNGLTLIDTGWDSSEAWGALTNGLSSIGASVGDVRACLITHQHVDHIGLAAKVKQASGAWIGLHPADAVAIMRPEFRNAQLSAEAEIRWMVRLGAPADEADALRLPLIKFDKRRDTVVPDRLIEDGAAVDVPNWSLRAIHTPGHTPGHLCYFDTRTRLLFSGDHVLPRITPNISAYHDEDQDALGDFLTSLGKIESEQADEVLPAHEWRFQGLSARVRELRQHHERRLRELLGIVCQHPDSTPWFLASQMTWSRPWAEYDGHMRVSAVGETASHAAHLAQWGLLTAPDADVLRYTAAETASRTSQKSK